MKFRVQTQGFAELEKALEEFRPPTAKNVLRRAGLGALKPVADGMKAKAPKRFENLRDAIDTGTKRQKGTKKHFPDSSTVEVYAGVSVVGGGMPPQAIQQEFGNERHGPQAYVRPGWDAEKGQVMDHLEDSLSTEIDKATARAQRRALKAKG